MTTTENTDPTIVTDRYTTPNHPPQVIDHQGAGWSATPAGTLLPRERNAALDGEEPWATDHTVALSRREANSMDYRRRLTIEGAIELADQLRSAATTCERAKAHDARPQHSDMVSGPMANSVLLPMGDEGVPTGSLLDDELNSTLTERFPAQPPKPRTVAELVAQKGVPTLEELSRADEARIFARVLSDGELVARVWVRREWLSDPMSVINEAEQVLSRNEVIPGRYVLVFPDVMQHPEPHVIDTRPEDYRTAGQAPNFSRQQDDDAYPELGRLAVLAEHYLMRTGEQGSITLNLTDEGDWLVAITQGANRDPGSAEPSFAHGQGATAAEAMRAALYHAGESL